MDSESKGLSKEELERYTKWKLKEEQKNEEPKKDKE
jgi:hypothetical protein